ncbi:phage tail tube protein [Aminipila butyrica]|uniref:Phage tail tube protein n=1 Tax=Aminipila butyrica TaxID=433296 RepID=A0A858BTW9_9FIRM|nr:phage tail tube protein [Aminipila butyrica]QIB68639.1 phage tail tube protein [Aminipila butyrica]
MLNHQIMNAEDAVSGSLAECYITIDGNRYNFMQLYKFESKVEKTISEVPILGRTGKGHKATGWKGTWTGTAHYNQSIMRELLLTYKEKGLDVPFDIQVTNEDETSSIGRQTIIHKNCLTSGGILAKYDADAEYLDEDIEGTFDDFEMPEKFNLLNGMR